MKRWNESDSCLIVEDDEIFIVDNERQIISYTRRVKKWKKSLNQRVIEAMNIISDDK